MFAENLYEAAAEKQNEGIEMKHGQKIFKNSDISRKKSKNKKNKKGETDTKNISVRSSFNKFDALQKRNIIHVRSIGASKAHEKFSNPQDQVLRNCHLCDKVVYKMEEIKAEKKNYHKDCFRCRECKKQLKVDSYQSHQGVLFCNIHFKLLFNPKSVEDNEAVPPKKPELIICESQPTELPPDVIRASDKPDLGLEELQQLNVRSRFQVFEHPKTKSNNSQKYEEKNSNNFVKSSSTILSKVAKLQQLSSHPNKQCELSSSSDNEDEVYDEKKLEQKRESPVGIGEAMNDILCLFEKGHAIRKEERREERKQEIQNIRSRLFMGKQARIKEMYQQAVAESENATDKKSTIEIEVDSRSLRSRFENGEVFKGDQVTENNDNCRKPAIEREADVFESAISKKSRSIFMELDANLITAKNQTILPLVSNNRGLEKQNSSGNINYKFNKNELENNVVKCGEAVEDVKIQTSEISEKFKFFEKYCPTEVKKSAFRITPPREGVVKMPSPDENDCLNENIKNTSPDQVIIAHSRTTSMMLKKFKELENNPNEFENMAPKPLKRFTPPPDGNQRLYTEQESDEFGSYDDEDEDESSFEEGDDDRNDNSQLQKDDESLREAQNAAKAKQLRIKFEKWQSNKVEHGSNDDIDQSKSPLLDENSLESTRLIRERFEKMKNVEKLSQTTRPRYQVKRFV